MTVSVALVPVARGDTLSQDKAHLENRMVWGKPQPPVAAVPSGIMRRPVKAGEVIDPAFVAALFAVQAGDTLLVTMKEPALTIHLHAIALSGGALGATIPVRVSPARVARAEVTGRSTAMLKP